MKTVDYLAEIKKAHGIESDYALAKLLGTSRAAVSRYRRKQETFSDATALKVAELLGIPSGRVLVDMQIQRAHTPQQRAAWREILERISSTAAVILIVLGSLTKPGEALANQSATGPAVDFYNGPEIYIMRIIGLILALASLVQASS